MNNASTKSISRLLIAFLVVGSLASCKNENLIRRGDSLKVAFQKSVRLYQAGDYREAADGFGTVLEIGRGTDYGKKAQLYLAESYFKDERYLQASSEFQRYISLYPRSDKRKKAQFKEAFSYYKLSPRYRIDQSYTKKAIEKFQLFNSRYSGTSEADKAANYITEMRTKLARKLFNASDLYMRTDSYQAAITYYDLTINKYPETIWAQHALVDKIEAYNVYAGRSVRSKQHERYNDAVKAYEKFIQLFPNGKFREEAENRVDEARSALADLPAKSEIDDKNTAVEADQSE